MSLIVIRLKLHVYIASPSYIDYLCYVTGCGDGNAIIWPAKEGSNTIDTTDSTDISPVIDNRCSRKIKTKLICDIEIDGVLINSSLSRLRFSLKNKNGTKRNKRRNQQKTSSIHI